MRTSTLISTLMTTGLLFGATLSLSPAQAQDATSLNLTVSGMNAQKGKLMIGVYKGEEAYKSGVAAMGSNPDVTADSISATFTDLEPGEYAIKLFHDVNGDGEMNTNPFGMPVEPFAFSNNAAGRFGPASWDAAKFTVESGDNVQAINMGGK